MPDITMCPGTNCPHKETCYRFTAEPSDYQAYFTVPPLKNGQCEMYWGVKSQAIFDQVKNIVDGKE
jgi:hypothetical protein